MKTQMRLRRLVLVAVVILLVFLVAVRTGFALESGAYSHEPTIGIERPDWMSELPDEAPLSWLSIPGTHDSLAPTGFDIEVRIPNWPFEDIVFTIPLARYTVCNTADLDEQLNSGIRVFDIRLWNYGAKEEPRLGVFHGPFSQYIDFDAVLNTMKKFLAAHPGETVLMKIQEETFTALCDYQWLGLPCNEPEPDLKFWTHVANYLDEHGKDIVLRPTTANPNPMLGDLRGKIVVFDNTSRDVWDSFDCLDDYDIQDYASLGTVKWPNIREHLDEAAYDASKSNEAYVTYLSANGAAGLISTDLIPPFIHIHENVPAPYFFASGHVSPETGAARRHWTDCPRAGHDCDWYREAGYTTYDCDGSTCKLYHEGTNDLLTFWWFPHNPDAHRVGIIMADFPGPDLIQEVIDVNNRAPTAMASVPARGFEGSPVELDASASSDPDGDGLTYKWTFEVDGLETLITSSTPTVTHTWQDDWAGDVRLEVTDQGEGEEAYYHYTRVATSSLAILNVAPVVDAGPDLTATVGTPVTFSGSFTDPGALDTHTIAWDFGDGTTAAGTLTPLHHFAVGTYTVTLTVTDDDLTVTDYDGCTATDEAVVTVEPATIYLPLVMNHYVSAPDLVVERLSTTPNNVQVVVANRGDAPASEPFWVDVYVDPGPAPTAVNQIWNDLADQGLVWGVQTPLAPGEVLTLTLGDAYYAPQWSAVSWPLALGTPVYAQVDAWNDATAHGAVRETHEIAGGPYNNIASTSVSAAVGVTAPAATRGRSTGYADLPPRRHKQGAWYAFPMAAAPGSRFSLWPTR